MTTYVALLRAVNVGAHGRCKMADLRAAFVKAGYANATTYIQSGNVLFSSRSREASVRDAIEDFLAADLGLHVRALIRSAEEMSRALAANPFVADDPKLVHVFFLDHEPSAGAAAALDAVVAADATRSLVGRELFVRYTNGLGVSKFGGSVVEKKLQAVATARNITVTAALAGMAAEFR